MDALYETPQNNFKISSSSGSIFSHEKSNCKDREEIDAIFQNFLSDEKSNSLNGIIDREKECAHAIENEKLQNCRYSAFEKSSEYSGVTDIIDVLTCILKSESVLRDIHSLQSADILDVEGGF